MTEAWKDNAAELFKADAPSKPEMKFLCFKHGRNMALDCAACQSVHAECFELQKAG